MNSYTLGELENESLKISSKYLEQSYINVVKIYGLEYAQQHPELIIGLMNTTAYTFRTEMLKQGIQAIDDSLENINNRLSWMQNDKKKKS